MTASDKARVSTVQSNMDVFRRVWDAYAIGRHDELLSYLDPDVELSPALAEDVLQGHDAIARWLVDSRREYKSVTLVFEAAREVADDCIVAFGRISAYDFGGERRHDFELAWVSEYRELRLLRAAAFRDRDEALAYVTARRQRL